MNKGVLGGGMLVVALMAAGPVWAQSPMSPVKPMSPGATRQWVEPPAADKPDTPPSSTAADAGSAAEKPQASQPEDNSRPRSSQRAAARGNGSGGSTASRLNRQELSRLRSGGGSYYSGYYSGYRYYGQPAYSYSGY
jgi:hypothetical protein